MARRFATRTIHNFPLVSENEKGERVTEKASVIYRSYSQKLLEEIEAAETTEGNKSIPFSAYLSHQVVAIHVDGKPLTGEDDLALLFYDGQSEESLKAARGWFDTLPISDVTKPMYEAIENDVNPLRSSPGSGGSGSPATANAE